MKIMEVQVLYGERIYLRRLTEEDVTDDYVRWMNDPMIIFMKIRLNTGKSLL